MKKILFLLLICFLHICSCSKHVISLEEKNTNSTLYTVRKIKKVNSWYFIYLKRNDSIFKVVTREPSDKSPFEGYRKIKKYRRYNMQLHSYKEGSIFNGVNIWPLGYTGGFQLDSITTVRLEPENDIWDLYSTDDLEGLYYLK